MAKIMIVDDSQTSRLLLKSMLMKMNHEVIGEASNGLEGYEMYFVLKPDIVTMDITMPILDGVSCIEKIKKQDPTAKILLITSNAQTQKLSNAIAVGTNGYVFKPIIENELENALSAVLNA